MSTNNQTVQNGLGTKKRLDETKKTLAQAFMKKSGVDIFTEASGILINFYG